MSKIFSKKSLFSALILLVVILSGCTSTRSVFVNVISVIDGDTIRVMYDTDDDGLLDKVSVRYIGIDTPEINPGSKPFGEYGEEAYELNRTLIETSDYEVRLEVYGTDYYDRVLAYVYTRNGVFINEEIIENGLARPLTYNDTAHHSEDFKEAYYNAYEKRKGLFAKYNTESFDASVVNSKLTDYLGKVIWIEFKVDYGNENSLHSTYAVVEIREEEKSLFFSDDADFANYDGKIIKVFGEIWEENDKPKILLRAPFELKIKN
ncbi:MAG: thermonuclease family protein [Kosmotogaceae bacterium]